MRVLHRKCIAQVFAVRSQKGPRAVLTRSLIMGWSTAQFSCRFGPYFALLYLRRGNTRPGAWGPGGASGMDDRKDGRQGSAGGERVARADGWAGGIFVPAGAAIFHPAYFCGLRPIFQRAVLRGALLDGEHQPHRLLPAPAHPTSKQFRPGFAPGAGRHCPSRRNFATAVSARLGEAGRGRLADRRVRAKQRRSFPAGISQQHALKPSFASR